MTDRELKRLSRMDLVEMLLALTTENEQLRQELSQVKQQLESRMIAIEDAGSLAEAAMKLNHVFEAAQAACEQYSENLQFRVATQKETCDRMEQETREKCEKMVEDAKRQADAYWEYVREKVRGQYFNQEIPQQPKEQEAEE